MLNNWYIYRYLKDELENKSVSPDKQITKPRVAGHGILCDGKLQGGTLHYQIHVVVLIPEWHAGVSFWPLKETCRIQLLDERTHALLLYSGYNIKDVQKETSEARQDKRQEDQQVISSIVESFVAVVTVEENAYGPPDPGTHCRLSWLSDYQEEGMQRLHQLTGRQDS